VLARAVLGLGAALGWFVFHVVRVRRAHVEASLARAGLDARVPGQVYRELGVGLAEILLARWRPDAARERVVIEPAARGALERARAAGPVILACSHTGNWEAAAFAAAGLAPLACVVKPISNRAIDAFCTRTRERMGLRLLSPRGAIRAASRALAEGHAVAMMIDQVPADARHGVWTPFLGAPALVDRAPFALAARTGASVLVTCARRDAEGITRVDVVGTLAPPSSGRPAWIDAATRESTALLAAFVRANPSSWLWLHRRWKTPPSRRSPALPLAAGQAAR
jgi:KDO2-lipid IV(A) lauroyltransferase